MRCISSAVNARSDSVRTVPLEPNDKANAANDSSSRKSRMRTRSYLPRVHRSVSITPPIRCARPRTCSALLTALVVERQVRSPTSSPYALMHAYAILVHKTQGMGFPVVVIPPVTSNAVLLSWTLLYTALTRTRRLVVSVG